MNLMDMWDKIRGRKTQAEKEAERLLLDAAPRAPLIERLSFQKPSELSDKPEFRARQVAMQIRAKLGSRVSRRVVKKISAYYGVDLRGLGLFQADRSDKRNAAKMLIVLPA